MMTGSRMLERGKTYADLRPLIAIHLLGEPLLPEKTHGGAYHSIFELRHHQTNERLTDLLSVHLIELPRLTAACSTSEDKWLTFLLRGHTMSQPEIAALNVPAIEQADQRLREISTDWHLRMAQVQQEMAERDSYSFVIDAGREGERRSQRKSLLKLLEMRGIALTPEQRARIAACEDLNQLDAWFAQAFHCQRADELV